MVLERTCFSLCPSAAGRRANGISVHQSPPGSRNGANVKASLPFSSLTTPDRSQATRTRRTVYYSSLAREQADRQSKKIS